LQMNNKGNIAEMTDCERCCFHYLLQGIITPLGLAPKRDSRGIVALFSKQHLCRSVRTATVC
jgi:hypothetical protein